MQYPLTAASELNLHLPPISPRGNGSREKVIQGNVINPNYHKVLQSTQYPILTQKKYSKNTQKKTQRNVTWENVTRGNVSRENVFSGRCVFGKIIYGKMEPEEM
jgi:hypothetical protein